MRHTHCVLLMIVFSRVVFSCRLLSQTTVFSDLGYQPKIVNEGIEGYWGMEVKSKEGWRRRGGEPLCTSYEVDQNPGDSPGVSILDILTCSELRPARPGSRPLCYLPATL